MKKKEIKFYKELEHGLPVICEIEGFLIEDAKISIDSDGEYFICQNKKNGSMAEDKLGYPYSWSISESGVDPNTKVGCCETKIWHTTEHTSLLKKQKKLLL